MIIKRDNSTLIKSSHFRNELGVHCYAAYVSVPKKIVILHNFTYAQIRAERRDAVRVKIHGALAATFSYENVSTEGNMVDISGNGVTIQTADVPAIDHDQPVQLSFRLMGIPLMVLGSFVRTTANQNGGCIYFFKMAPDRKSDTVIGKFIYQRQIEIIQELKSGLVEE